MTYLARHWQYGVYWRDNQWYTWRYECRSNNLYQCPTSQQGRIFDPLPGVSWWFRDAGSAHSVHGPSLWPARRFGTLYQTAWEIRILAGTASDVCWRRFYLQCSLRCFRTIRSTNWLTYLFGNLRLKNVRTLSLLLYFYNQKAILNILSTTFYSRTMKIYH